MGMVKVIFTANLRRYTGGVTETEASGERVRDLLVDLDLRIPGIRHYVVNDHGTLRRHVNIFVDGELVADRAALTDPLRPGCTVHILQALSGG
ncbi:MAG: MoaD/ThiS family protein [Planctomycetes bacterium]|nr:MoaD/ThiS family protein [Planctomycetota bacterium]